MNDIDPRLERITDVIVDTYGIDYSAVAHIMGPLRRTLTDFEKGIEHATRYNARDTYQARAIGQAFVDARDATTDIGLTDNLMDLRQVRGDSDVEKNPTLYLLTTQSESVFGFEPADFAALGALLGSINPIDYDNLSWALGERMDNELNDCFSQVKGDLGVWINEAASSMLDIDWYFECSETGFKTAQKDRLKRDTLHLLEPWVVYASTPEYQRADIADGLYAMYLARKAGESWEMIHDTLSGISNPGEYQPPELPSNPTIEEHANYDDMMDDGGNSLIFPAEAGIEGTYDSTHSFFDLMMSRHDVAKLGFNEIQRAVNSKFTRLYQSIVGIVQGKDL